MIEFASPQMLFLDSTPHGGPGFSASRSLMIQGHEHSGISIQAQFANGSAGTADLAQRPFIFQVPNFLRCIDNADNGAEDSDNPALAARTAGSKQRSPVKRKASVYGAMRRSSQNDVSKTGQRSFPRSRTTEPR